MRRVPIRMKLAGALAVPLTALVAVTALEVRSAADEASRIQDQTALAEISLGPTSILSAIEWERNAVSVDLLGLQDAFTLEMEDPVAAADETDAAIETFRAEVDRQDQAVVDAYAPAFAAMEGLGELRARAADTPEAERTLANIDAVSGLFDEYTAIRDQLVDANRQVALAIDDPVLRQGADLIDLNSTQTDLVAILVRDLLATELGGTRPDGPNAPQELALIASNLGHLRTNWAAMTSIGTGPYAPLIEDLLAAEEVQRFPEVVDEAMRTGTVDLLSLTAYAASDDPEALAYTVFGRGVEDVVRDHAHELEAAAEARQRWFVVLAAAAVTVAALAAWLVSRSITRPLRSLTREAKEMAERRLPDAVLHILETPLGDDVRVPTVSPVSATTRDEVADVAVALNTVQDTALDLAVEQAVLRRNIADSFVNLGRRNQNLLGRQLDFITELETNEADPDALANLFRLDHLATRMRRNAESLLVLAGIEPPRQWAAPVRLTDVIRAALGEVEDYQRVVVRGVEPATVLGSAAADLAHLMAELIENALVFSPPDQTVDIRGRNRPDGYTLAIIDSGLGMPASDIAAANRRLAGEESFTIAPSKYLGHYVAGNLAARHDIRVTLDNSPGNGVTATIDVPPTLLTSDAALPQSDEPHAARAVWPPAPGGEPDAPLSPPPPAPAPAGLPAPQAPAPSPSLPPPPGPPEAPAWAQGGPPPAPAPGPVGATLWADPAPTSPPEVSPPPAAGPARRTASGLVRRTPRIIDTGEVRAVGRPADGELLDALSRYTTTPGTGRDGDLPAPGSPPAPAADGRPSTRPAGAPFAAPPSHAPHARPTPLIAPPDPAARPIGSSAAPRSTPADGGGGPVGTTGAGLPRRVRGAQLPTATPISIRRGRGADGEPDAGPAESPRPRPGPVPPDDSIFSFLSQFTAGVQRGLDAAPPPDGEDRPPRR